jgi:hypothetical protein
MQSSDRITVAMGDVTELAVDTVIAKVMLVCFNESTTAEFRRALRHG